jgi:hypothetical protein
MLQQGQRYWYYYIIDGYHVSHDPSQDSTKEPTTGRVLNILDVPSDKKSSSSSKSKDSKSSSKSSSKTKDSKSSSKHSSTHRRETRAATADIPKGRPLSVSQIQSPKPISPHATKAILEEQYGPLSGTTVEELTSKFSETTFSDSDYELSSSPPSSVGSSLSSRSDSSSPSSASSLSDYSTSSQCSCERYGITRSGDRIKLDCGGSRCGYSDEDSCCSSSEDDEISVSARRQGIVVRR